MIKKYSFSWLLSKHKKILISFPKKTILLLKNWWSNLVSFEHLHKFFFENERSHYVSLFFPLLKKFQIFLDLYEKSQKIREGLN